MSVSASDGWGGTISPDLHSKTWNIRKSRLLTTQTGGQTVVTFQVGGVSAQGSYGPDDANDAATHMVSVNANCYASLVTYSLSVNAGGNESSQTGTAGNYFDTYFRDSNYEEGEDTEENSGTGKTRYLPTDKKHFYAVVTATVTLPKGVVPPSSVTAKVRRIRYVNNVAVPAGDAQKSVTLNLVVQSAYGAPVYHTDATTYTYRTHDLEPIEQTPYYIAGSEDVWIDDWLGRWQFSLDNFNTNVDLKIDKRSQLTTYAYDWAEFWPHRPESSKRYYTTPREGGGTDTGLDEANYRDSTGTELFTQCHSFVAHIYNKMGLYAPYTTDVASNGIQGTAVSIDDGCGAIRCFTGHSGIIGALGLLWGGEIVDINNPEEEMGHHGVETHGWNVGGPLLADPNRTMPDPANASDPEHPGKIMSFLKVLERVSWGSHQTVVDDSLLGSAPTSAQSSRWRLEPFASV